MIAVVLTVAAAMCFALSSVAEQRSAKRVPEHGSLSPRLLLDLARQRRWLAAIAVNVAGNALQVAALHFGGLALVRPLLVSNLVFAVLVAGALWHRPPDRIVLGGVICCAAGIACFLAVGQPGGGHKTVGYAAALPITVSLAAVLAGSLSAARWGPRRFRGIWLAVACGSSGRCDHYMDDAPRLLV